jgi:hypothetical protein
LGWEKRSSHRRQFQPTTKEECRNIQLFFSSGTPHKKGMTAATSTDAAHLLSSFSFQAQFVFPAFYLCGRHRQQQCCNERAFHLDWNTIENIPTLFTSYRLSDDGLHLLKVTPLIRACSA